MPKKNMETNPISTLLIPINSNKPLKRHCDRINKRRIQKYTEKSPTKIIRFGSPKKKVGIFCRTFLCISLRIVLGDSPSFL